MSETDVQAFTPLERQKTVMLEELVSLRSDDINKLNVNEDLLRDLVQRQGSCAGDTHAAWAHGSQQTQALRQLYGASHRAPRLREFPPQQSQNQSVRRQRQPEQPAQPPPTRPTAVQIRRVLRPPPDDSPEALLTSLTDRLVNSCLARAATGVRVNREASGLVRLTLESAERRLEDAGSR